jgi:hypothetical protein
VCQLDVNQPLRQGLHLPIYLGAAPRPYLCTALLTPWPCYYPHLPPPDGFLLVDDCLRSEGGPPNVFAAGDVASNRANPRPKAGVFAVRAVSAAALMQCCQACTCQLFVLSRLQFEFDTTLLALCNLQGPPLAENLRRALAGEPLQTWRPQTTFLSLVSAGDKYAVATKGWLGELPPWLVAAAFSCASTMGC